MPKSGKRARQPGKHVPRVAGTIAANTGALFEMAGRLPDLADRANPVLLAAYIKARPEEFVDSVSKSHIYRMLDGERAVGADVLDMVAHAFGLEAWHMLVPGMQPQNPPSVLVTSGQRKLFKSLEESYREIGKPEGKHGERRAAGSVDEGRDTARAAGGAGDNRPKSATAKPAGGKTKARAKART